MGNLTAKQTKLKNEANAAYLQSLDYEQNASEKLNHALIGTYEFGLTFANNREELVSLIKDMGFNPSREDTTWWTDVVKACFVKHKPEQKNSFDLPASSAITKYQTILAYAHYSKWDKETLKDELESLSANEIHKIAKADGEFSSQYLNRSNTKYSNDAATKKFEQACQHAFKENSVSFSKEQLDVLLEETDAGFGSILFKRENGQIKFWPVPADQSQVNKIIAEYAKINNPRKALSKALTVRSMLTKSANRHIQIKDSGEGTQVTMFGLKAGSPSIVFLSDKIDILSGTIFDDTGMDQLIGLSRGVGDERFVWKSDATGVKVTAEDQAEMPDTEAIFNYLFEEKNGWSAPDGTDRIDYFHVPVCSKVSVPEKFSTSHHLTLNNDDVEKIAIESSWNGLNTTLAIKDQKLLVKCAKKSTVINCKNASDIGVVKFKRGEIGKVLSRFDDDGVSLSLGANGLILEGHIKKIPMIISIASVK